MLGIYHIICLPHMPPSSYENLLEVSVFGQYVGIKRVKTQRWDLCNLEW